MEKKSIKNIISGNLSNIPGWNTKRKLVIIESDDWGSIRMPSLSVYNNLVNEGLDLTSDEGSRFNAYDSLASSEDLTALFETLGSVKDSTGKPTVITPISVVANPNFKRIKESDFCEYFYEPFTETLKEYPGCENSFALWQEGITHRLFVPQFHGREHLNVKVWMNALKKGHKQAMLAFNNNMWGITTQKDPEIRTEFQAAFDFIDPEDIDYHKIVIQTGLRLFKMLFNYKATYFVPPNGPFSTKLESLCFAEGIKYLSVSKIQDEPIGYGKVRKRFHWLGQRTTSGITCLTRNCFFEPSQPGQDWINSCLSDISIAFKWYKPAIISSHRVNYIGALNIGNRDNGLKNLGLLLKNIMKLWPDTEFVTSEELGEIIRNG